MSMTTDFIALGGVVVTAKKKKKSSIKSLEDLIKTLTDKDDIRYAKAYYKWVQGDREGKFPKGKGTDKYAIWKYIRRMVTGIPLVTPEAA